ncbi:MAG: ABC transporter permease [Bacteroidota bacterium]
MTKNFLLVTLRSLRRQPVYAAINVLGLAVGLACCLLLALYLQNALSYDRFLERADDTYRLARDFPVDGGTMRLAWTSGPVGPIIAASLPEVEAATRIATSDGKVLVENERYRAYETGFVYADANLFGFFGLPIRGGQIENALAQPYTVALSASAAARYFGEADAIGNEVEVDGTPYEIVGVFEDLPSNTHLRFDMVGSRASQIADGLDPTSWTRGGAMTYVRLEAGQSPADVEAKLPALVRVHDTAGFLPADRFTLTPVTDIHLFARHASEYTPQGDIRYVLLFGAVAFVILLVACINYANLATAQAARRGAEVGVRKTLGAGRGQLVRQFLGESALLCGAAMLLAAGLAEAALPFLNAQLDLALSIPWTSPLLLATLALAIGAVAFLAGGYPTLVLARFEPVRALRGRGLGAGASRLRQGLIVFQLAASVALIACTLVMNRQMDLVQQSRPGFGDAQVLMLDTHGGLDGRYGALRTALEGVAAVEAVTTTSFSPGRPTAITFIDPSTVEGTTATETIVLSAYQAGAGFASVFGFDLVAGRPLGEPATGSDAAPRVLLNEAAMQHLGWTEAVGRQLDLFGSLHIVEGVLEDFHAESLHEAVEPAVFMTAAPVASDYVAVKVAPGDLAATLAAVQGTWDRLVPERPFAYSFLDADFDALHRTELRLEALFALCAALAIGIACLGLFGMAALTTVQRTKEIGIRKVLGASVASIAALLSTEYVKLVAVAVVVAGPLAYLAMRTWLASFAYRVDLNLGLFVLAGVAALALTLVAVGVHALRAATADPVRSLRHD